MKINKKNIISLSLGALAIGCSKQARHTGMIEEQPSERNLYENPLGNNHENSNGKFYKNYTFYKKPTEGGNQSVYIFKNNNSNEKKVLKVGKEERVTEEIIAARFYITAGIGAPPNDFLFLSKGELEKLLPNQNSKNWHDYNLVSISEYIEGEFLSKKITLDDLSNINSIEDLTKEKQTIVKEFCEGFLMDCVLGNWDIPVGFKNTFITPDGKSYRFDNGGSLHYRALGGLKQESDLEKFSEPETFLNPNINKYGAAIYKFLSREDIIDQAKNILSKKDRLLQAVDDFFEELKSRSVNYDEKKFLEKIKSIKSLLVNRLKLMQAYILGNLIPEVIYDKRDYIKTDAYGIATKNSAAGMLNYYKDENGKIYVLLGKRRGHEYWGNFGGGSETDKEKPLVDTASREVFEESLGEVFIPKNYVKKCPSHDLISKKSEADFRPKFKNNQELSLYRMYLVEGKYTAPEKLNEKIKNSKNYCQKEYTDFMWVELNSLMDEFKKANEGWGKKTSGDDKNGVQVSAKNEKGEDIEFEIHYPLFCMLRQAPVLENLEKIVKGEKPSKTHTSGSINLSNDFTKEVNNKESKEVIDLDIYKKIKNPYAIDNQMASQVVGVSRIQAVYKAVYKRNIQEAFSKIYSYQQEMEEKKTTSLTTTEAMLKKFLNDPKAEFSKASLESLYGPYDKEMNFEESFLERLIKAFEEEKKHNDKFFVFYHACEPFIGFLLDVINMMRNYLSEESPEGIRFFRAFDDQFTAKHSEVLKSTLAIKDYGIPLDYKGNFPNLTLSVNVSLVGSHPSIADYNRSSSIKLFDRGDSVNAPDKTWLLQNALEAIGMGSYLGLLQSLFDKYFGKNLSNGRLIQIFVDPHTLDSISYGCIPGGYPIFDATGDDIQEKMDKNKLSEILANIKTNNTKIKVDGQIIPLEYLQARLYLNPEFFSDSKNVFVKSYWREDVAPEYQKELSRLGQNMMTDYLQKFFKPNDGMVFNNRNPLAESYQHFYESENGENTYLARELRNKTTESPIKNDSDILLQSEEMFYI